MPSKGNEYLVAAAPARAGTAPAARFYLVGEGELQGDARGAGRTRSVSATASCSPASGATSRRRCRALDLGVFPSLWEGTPLTAFEALAMGKPIVATDADGLLDILTDRPRRADRAEAERARRSPRDRRLASDPAERARLSAARASTGAQYDIDAFVRKMERLYVLLHETSRATRRAGHPDCGSRLPVGNRSRVVIADRLRAGWRWAKDRPGILVATAVAVVFLGFAVSVDFPRAAHGFKGDEATYYSLTYSLAQDWDFAFQRRDLVRVWEEFPGPEGIFLKRGSKVDVQGSSRFPFVHLEQSPDPSRARLFYGKSYIYPLFAAPFVRLFGTSGFLIFHALLLTLNVACGYVLPPGARLWAD